MNSLREVVDERWRDEGKPSPPGCIKLVPAFSQWSLLSFATPTTQIMNATPSSVTARYGVEEPAKTLVSSQVLIV
ncbi:hypothetical protein TNCV_2772361 [Trichonephila clavipes]|nr:hypothetical protein TNCV_2772361 [Trichonephila clavipes]